MTAIEAASAGKQKSLELRAATGLACLQRELGDIRAARDILEPVYNWFTEGFDTPDLRAAWVLLSEL